MADAKLLYESFWIDRWMGSSAFLLPIEPRGLYREMLSQAWRRGARLPNDEQAVQRAVGCSAEEWGRCWPRISKYWTVEGDSLVNATQQALYADAKGRVDRAHTKAMNAAASSPQVRNKRDREAQGQPQAPPCEDPAVAVAVTEIETVAVAECTARRNGALAGNGQDGALTDSERREFSEAVWQEFSKLTGQVRTMSSPEFDVVREWMNEGIPLRIALRGMADTKGKGRMLGYYGPSVKAAYAQWRQAVQVTA